MSRANNRVEPTAEKFIFEESVSNSEGATLRGLIGIDPAGSNVIHVSKATAATDTRTGLSKYDAFKPFATIGEAIDASVSGDLILVEPGVFSENIRVPENRTLKGSGMGLTSIQPESGIAVVVDGNNVSLLDLSAIGAVGVTSEENYDSVLISGCYTEGVGDGIFFDNGVSNLTVQTSVIKSQWDGIVAAGDNILINDCDITVTGEVSGNLGTNGVILSINGQTGFAIVSNTRIRSSGSNVEIVSGLKISGTHAVLEGVLISVSAPNGTARSITGSGPSEKAVTISGVVANCPIDPSISVLGLHIDTTAGVYLDGRRSGVPEQKSDSGDFESGNFENRQVINIADNTFKIYADGAWRQIATW
jgi:hypothetical protein